MGDIGGRVYDLYDRGEGAQAGADQKIKDAVEKIRGYRAEIQKWEQEIENAKSERREQEQTASEREEKVESES
jgi:hypothetical protein